MNNLKNVVLIALVVWLIPTSCTDNESQEFLQNEDTTWMDQLNYVKSGAGNELLNIQGLKLVNFEIVDNKKYMDAEELTPNTIVPYYNDSTDINKFRLSVISDIKSFNNINILESYLQKKKDIIEHYSNPNLRIVQLDWNYENKKFTTECIVNDTCVVYDDILSNIQYINIVDKPINPIVPLFKTRSEPNQIISFTYTSPEFRAIGLWGKVVAAAYCSITIKGENVNGKKYIYSYENNSRYASNPGYTAVAEVKIISFDRRETDGGHCEYQCAVMVATGSFSIGWNGSGFTIPPGTNGMTTGRWVNASDLN